MSSTFDNVVKVLFFPDAEDGNSFSGTTTYFLLLLVVVVLVVVVAPEEEEQEDCGCWVEEVNFEVVVVLAVVVVVDGITEKGTEERIVEWEAEEVWLWLLFLLLVVVVVGVERMIG